MSFDPKINRNEKDAIGDPGDSIATNTTEAWTSISLLKAIARSLGVGLSFTPSTDVAQGSTTLGQTGGLTQAAVTTAAPSYTTGKTNPLSLKTNGDLRVADTDAIAQLTTANSALATLNMSTDTLEAALGIITETAPATDTASSGLNGRLQRIAQRLTSLIAQIPATLGVKARTASLSVAMATEDAALFPASLGAKAAASSFAVTQSTEDAAQLGSLTETAPATDTASSGLNGRMQRVAQRLTSLIALVPTSLGGKTAANSFAVTTASDDPPLALLGAVTETAPATDTASSGLNGRLQRIAQRITSLIALVPASLGAKTAAASFSVTVATDDAVMGGTADAAATAGSTGSISAKLRAISRDIVANIVLAAGSAIIGKVGIDQTTPGTTDHVTSSQRIATISTTITRPADTTAYAANDVLSDSTSAPTSGGFTFTSAATSSGGYGVIKDAIVSASAGTAYQGEIWIFDQSVTAKNDNAAFDVSDSDVQKLVGIIPFNTNDTTSSNAVSYITGLDIGYTCIGTANLRFLVKIMAAVTPGNAEVLAIRIKVQN